MANYRKRSGSSGISAHLKLLGITLGSIVLVAAALFALIYGSIALRAPTFGIITAFVLLLMFIYYYGKVVAYRAPVKGRIRVFKFEHNGEQFESVVERASYFYTTSRGGGHNVEILRLSIYNRSNGQSCWETTRDSWNGLNTVFGFS